MVVFGALLPVTQLPEMFGRWDNFLSRGLADEAVEGFRRRERNGETTCLAWELLSWYIMRVCLVA
mgnify:CR=1 FL=1